MDLTSARIEAIGKLFPLEEECCLPQPARRLLRSHSYNLYYIHRQYSKMRAVRAECHFSGVLRKSHDSFFREDLGDLVDSRCRGHSVLVLQVVCAYGTGSCERTIS